MRELIFIFLLSSAFLTACNQKEKEAKLEVRKYIQSFSSDPNSLDVHSEDVEKLADHTYKVTIDFSLSNEVGGKFRQTDVYKVIGSTVIREKTSYQEGK